MSNIDQRIEVVKFIAKKLGITDLDQHPYDLYQLCLFRVKSRPQFPYTDKLRQLDGLILPPSPFPPLNEVELNLYSVELYINELGKHYPKQLVEAIDEAKELYQLGISALDGYRKSRYMELSPEDIKFLQENVRHVLDEFSETESLQHCCFRIGVVDDLEKLYELTPEFDIDYLYANPDMIDYVYFSSVENSIELYGILKDGRPFFALPNFPKLFVV